MNEVTIKTRSFPPLEQADNSECSICLETFDSSKRSVTTTECHHTFDSDCLAKWLTYKSSCPLCYKMLPDRSLCEVSQEEVVPDEPICPICRECLECPEEPVSITPCLHRFHSKCLSQWSNSSSNPACPMCRAPFSEHRAPERGPFSPPPIDYSRTEGMVCTICMSSISSRSRAIITPCQHYFHMICFNRFYGYRGGLFCPLCRVLLPPPVAIGRDTLRNTNTAGRTYVFINMP